MDQRLLRAAWLGAFGAIVIAPALLWLAAVSPTPTIGPAGLNLWSKLSTITGLLALSALVCAVILPSRLRSLNRAFGIESVIEIHRFLGVVAAILVLTHLAAVVAAHPGNVALLDVSRGNRPAQAAVGATGSLIALVALALARRRMRLTYELWRGLHLSLAVAVLVGSAAHVWLLDKLVRDPAMGALFTVFAVVVLGIFGYRWTWRSLFDPSTEFVVREVRRESPTVSTIVLEPRSRPDGPGPNWAFAPGQFAWVRLDRSVTAEEHPFTIASSAHVDTTEFTIRHVGDFTRTLRRLPPGSPVWVDGPHGAFTNDLGRCGGFVMITGGVGVTPMMSMLRTAAHRADPRPYRLVVTAGAPVDLLFRPELVELRGQLDLEIVEVVRHRAEGWGGYTGELGVDLLSMVLATVEDVEDLDYFVSGPPSLVTDAMSVLHALAVAADRVHTEQFDFV